MQNVKLTGHRFVPTENFICASVDSIGDRIFALTTGGIVYLYDRSTFLPITEPKQIACLSNISQENVVSFRYNEESSARAILICRDGTFYVIGTSHHNELIAERCAHLDEGVAAAAWSPDGDICAIISTLNLQHPRLTLITSKMDTVFEKDFVHDLKESPEQPESCIVSVGWGKKETQFHASEGKQAAFTADQEATPAFNHDDRNYRIAWRPDGLHFVVDFVNLSNGCRDFRVFNRSGSFYSIMEATSGMGQALAWRPYSVGGFIASPCQVGDNAKIIFFERNGLRHGHFEMPFENTKFKVVNISFSKKLCFVQLEELDGCTGTKKTFIASYTTLNYHWYLKQVLTFPTDEFVSFWLDEGSDRANRLYVGLKNRLVAYDFNFQVDCCRDHKVIAAIDGSELLLTPSKLLLPPPPLCHSRCRVEQSFISMTAFASVGEKELLVATVDCFNQVSLFKYNYSELDNEPQPYRKSFKITGGEGVRGLLLFSEGMKVVYCTTKDLSTSLVNVHSIEIGEEKHFEVPGNVIATTRTNEGNYVMQNDSGRVLSLDVNTGQISPINQPSAFPRHCYQIQIANLPNHNNVKVAVGLCSPYQGGPLYFGNHQLSACAISMAVDDRFLVYTTTEHRAYFLPLFAISAIDNVSSLATWFTEVTSGPASPLKALLTRPVERGSTLISIDTLTDGSAIFEMPRGNLEKIHPRPLVLESVIEDINERLVFSLFSALSNFIYIYISRKLYQKAFKTCLKHRISLNFLYDLNPEQFENHVEHFCRQLATPEQLNLFILDLNEDNVVQTLYPSMIFNDYLERDVLNSKRVESKIDRVCDLLMGAVQRIDEIGLYLVTLTCLAKRKVGTDIEQALLYLNEVSSRDKSKRDLLLNSGLKHLARMADVNDLYDVALGTYNLELALTVAERTQKDPREYRQELKDLSHMEPISYRQYKIDRKIGRLNQAVVHLCECGSERFEELLQFAAVEKPKQLLLAAKSVEKLENLFTHEQKVQIWGCHVEQLVKEKRYFEAAICSLRGNLFQEAIEFSSKSRQWDLAIVAASLMKNEINDESDDEVVKKKEHNDNDQVLESIAHTACESNDLAGAGRVFEIAADFEAAIDSFTDGQDYWSVFKLMACKMSKPLNAIREKLKVKVEEMVKQQARTLDEFLMEIKGYTDRLIIIDKENRNVFNFGEREIVLGGDGAESVAGVSTIASTAVRSGTSTFRTNASRTSSRTSANKWRLRPGSPTERFAIMERLIVLSRERLPEWRKEAEEMYLVTLLVLEGHQLFGSDGELPPILKELHSKMNQLVLELKAACRLGWSEEYAATLDEEQALQDESGDFINNTVKGLNLLDERIRYSPMCFVYGENQKLTSTSSGNIHNIVARFL